MYTYIEQTDRSLEPECLVPIESGYHLVHCEMVPTFLAVLGVTQKTRLNGGRFLNNSKRDKRWGVIETGH